MTDLETRPGRLARIDERLVPRLARGLRRVGNRARRIGSGGRPGRWVARVARRNPTITTAVATVAAAVVLIVVTGGDEHHAVAPGPPDAQTALPGDQLGPSTGESVSTYLSAVADRAGALPGSTAPSVTAVVDFTSYLTPAAAQAVLAGHSGVTASQAFVRVPPPASSAVHAVSLTSGTDLTGAVNQLAVNAREILASYHKHVVLARKHPGSNNVQIVTQYASLARQSRVDATGLRGNTGCVFALTVSGPPAEIEALAKTSDVRVLDPAPASVSASDLMVVPLEPQVTGVVPALNFALQ